MYGNGTGRRRIREAACGLICGLEKQRDFPLQSQKYISWDELYKNRSSGKTYSVKILSEDRFSTPIRKYIYFLNCFEESKCLSTVQTSKVSRGRG